MQTVHSQEDLRLSVSELISSPSTRCLLLRRRLAPYKALQVRVTRLKIYHTLAATNFSQLLLRSPPKHPTLLLQRQRLRQLHQFKHSPSTHQCRWEHI